MLDQLDIFCVESGDYSMKKNMKQNLVNLFKYNRTIYSLYYVIFSFTVNLLSFFVRTDDNLILFNSFGGRKYDDSPKEIYLNMKNDSRLAGYRFVWAFHEPEKFDVQGAEIIKTDSLKYFKTALKARVWITNSSVERGLSFKGKKTFYLNTWHGTPIKLMGTDISENNGSFKSNQKVSKIDVFCSQGKYETDIFSRSFNIERERILECGLPRNDILSTYTEEERKIIRKKLGIEANQRVVLYCPTYREYEKDEHLGVIMAPPIDLNKWDKAFNGNYVLFIRAHYEVSNVMGIKETDSIRNMSAYPSLNELFIASDMMISDYSSVFFDYSITGKPMLHFCYDYDTYSSKRGMYFDIREWINGSDNEDDLLKKILHISETDLKRTEEFRAHFVNFYGNAASQCVDCIAKEIIGD